MRALKIVEEFRQLPDTPELLVEGGDARIVLESGRNEYGCIPRPDPDLAQFGSSTASTISESGFAAAAALRERIVESPDEAACDREFSRIGTELAALCGIADLEGIEILFAASGTDIHRIASRMAAPGLVVMAEGAETGRGVPHALSGATWQVTGVNLRDSNGIPRDCGEIDEAFGKAVSSFAEKREGKVLLVLTDVSKTGLIAPSPSCALELKARFPDSIEVLVDACQFRMASSTLRAYLESGFMVAVTGSKFLTGPTFSGALLLPQSVTGRKMPKGPASRLEFPVGGNFGLLLRWEAALAELRAFCRIPEEKAGNFLARFAGAIGDRLEADPKFEPLALPRIDRRVLVSKPSWDQIQTIFPFRLRRGGEILGQQGAKRIHALLREDVSHVSGRAGLRCSLGQPVSCGALRICSSARLVAEGVHDGDAVIERALSALDRTAQLLSEIC